MHTLIIILNFNSSKDTINLANKILRITHFFVCIVDNNSSDNSLNEIHDFCKNNKRIKFIKSDVNGGYAKGNNIGLRYAKNNGYNSAFLINPDVTITDGKVFDKCLDILHNNVSALATGPMIEGISHYPLRPYLLSFVLPFVHRLLEKIYCRIQNKSKSESVSVYKLYGCFLCVSIEKIESLDFFDEETFLYYEESILAEKALLKNYTFEYIPCVSIYHASQGSVSQLGLSQFKFFFKSCFVYLRKYRGYSKLSAIFLSGIDIIFRFLINSLRRI